MIWEAVTAVLMIASAVGGVMAIFVRLSIDGALARFKIELLAELDRRYVTRAECEARARLEGRV